jgi:hypothetical protein
MPVSKIARAGLLIPAIMAGAAQAHEGLHLHPHLIVGPAAQPLHPAVVLALVVAAWATGLFVAEAIGRVRRRRRG